MRDMPLILNVVWGKEQTHLDLLGRRQEIEKIRAERKKEKPRGNGAYEAGKT